jgi:hypothetical protein
MADSVETTADTTEMPVTATDTNVEVPSDRVTEPNIKTKNNVLVSGTLIYDDPDGYVPNEEEAKLRTERNKLLTGEINARIMFLEEMYQILRTRLGDKVRYDHLFNIIRKLITDVEITMKDETPAETGDPTDGDDETEPTEVESNTCTADDEKNNSLEPATSREDNIDS